MGEKVYHVTLDDKFALYTSLAFDLYGNDWLFTPMAKRCGSCIVYVATIVRKYVLLQNY